MKGFIFTAVSAALFLSAKAFGQEPKAAENIIPDDYAETLTIRITDIRTVGSASAPDGKSATLLSFGGECDNEYFKGKVLPGACDCQRSDGETSTLSARYMLEGIDFEGDSCRIFIENNAIAGSPWSKPQIITDSKALSSLNSPDLIGFLDFSGPFTIRIYAHRAKP